MKIRNGFVSNSSSSSFIIGIGKIIDRQKADEFIKMYDKDNILGIKTLKELKEKDPKKYYEIEIDSTCVYIESFDSTTVEIDLNKLNEDDEIIYVSISESIDGDVDGEDEYSDDHFSDNVHKALSIFDDKSIIEFSNLEYGAGFNG